MSMDARNVIAANVKKLIDAASVRGVRSSIRSWSLSKGLDVRTIDRLVKGEHAINIDKLDEVARACGLQAWQLLREDFEPPQADAPAASPPALNEVDRLLLERLERILKNR